MPIFPIKWCSVCNTLYRIPVSECYYCSFKAFELKKEIKQCDIDDLKAAVLAGEADLAAAVLKLTAHDRGAGDIDSNGDALLPT